MTNVKPNRPARRPLQAQNALAYASRQGWVRRWVNDTMGRLEAFQDAGWTFVDGKDQDTSDKAVSDASALGSVVRRVVNRGLGADNKTAVLMEIPQEWYDEDQKRYNTQADDIDQSIRSQAPKGGYIKEASLIYKPID